MKKPKTVFDELRTELKKNNLDEAYWLIDNIETQIKNYTEYLTKPHLGVYKTDKDAAVDFYNARNDKELLAVYDKLNGFVDRDKDMLLAAFGDRDTDTIITYLRQEQKEFKANVDQVMSAELPDMHKINEVINVQYEVFFVGITNDRKIDKLPQAQWLIAIYAWLIDVANGVEKMPQRCSLEGCNILFINKPGGKAQKYCSNAHSMRAYRKRKQILA